MHMAFGLQYHSLLRYKHTSLKNYVPNAEGNNLNVGRNMWQKKF